MLVKSGTWQSSSSFEDTVGMEVGLRAAHDVWRMFTGSWEVRVTDNNLVARAFWQRAVSEFTGVRAESALTEVAGKRWHVFSFISNAPPKNSLDASGNQLVSHPRDLNA